MTQLTDQESAAFEAWAASIGLSVTGRYAETVDVLSAKSVFKAGYQAAHHTQVVQMTLEQAQQGVQPVAWLAEYVDQEGNSKWYVTTHKDLAAENDIHGTPKPLYTHPAMQV